MSTPCDTPKAWGPLDWLLTPLDDWCRFLMVAQELRDVDNECLDTLLEARGSGPAPLSPEEAAKVRSVIQMLQSLDLNPEAIRLTQPEVMQKLKRACLGCTERSRCDHELAAGTAAVAYREFCPNAPRLNALLSIRAAAA